MQIDDAHRRQGEQLKRLRLLVDEVRVRVARERGYVPGDFELLERGYRESQ